MGPSLALNRARSLTSRNETKVGMPSIRRVHQRDIYGCGVACVAMLAGVSYNHAKKAIFGDDLGGLYKLRGTDHEAIARGLFNLGLDCAQTKLTGPIGLRSLRKPAALMFRWPNARSLVHCVVWDPAFGGRIVDPAYRDPPRESVEDGAPECNTEFYFKAWKRSCKNWALVVTGKRRTDKIF